MKQSGIPECGTFCHLVHNQPGILTKVNAMTNTTDEKGGCQSSSEVTEET